MIIIIIFRILMGDFNSEIKFKISQCFIYLSILFPILIFRYLNQVSNLIQMNLELCFIKKLLSSFNIKKLFIYISDKICITFLLLGLGHGIILLHGWII